MQRRTRKLETPTFAQTIAIIDTMPSTTCQDVEAIIDRHRALGFHYRKDQIYRALKALTDPARAWDQRKRRSGRWT